MEQSQLYRKFSGLRTTAYNLIKNLKENYGFKLEPPIDIKGIIQFLGINYEIKPDFDNIKTSGNISCKSGIPEIWVNPMKNQSAEKKRFALAHELGHFMLHIAPSRNLNNFKTISDKNISFNRDDNWSYTEMEANEFATQLLMPVDCLNTKVTEIMTENPEITETEAIEKLSESFKVSEIAIEHRLSMLGVII